MLAFACHSSSIWSQNRSSCTISENSLCTYICFTVLKPQLFTWFVITDNSFCICIPYFEVQLQLCFRRPSSLQFLFVLEPCFVSSFFHVWKSEVFLSRNNTLLMVGSTCLRWCGLALASVRRSLLQSSASRNKSVIVRWETTSLWVLCESVYCIRDGVLEAFDRSTMQS